MVIIHGLGEQRPMATLRGFVDGITAWIKHFDSEKSRPRYWSRPDGISDMYETRRITMERTDQNPKTDFYEFYYAHHMRNTSYSHLVPWVWKLLSTSKKEVPPRLITLWVRVRILLAFLTAVATVAVVYRSTIQQFLSENLTITATAMALFLLLGRIVLWIVEVPFSQLLLNTAGDAARYFNPMPSNIDERSTIRREGIAFLRKLHDQTQTPYDRIVVVGHSLGSVVAYDMIRLLWHEMHETFSPVASPEHAIFNEMDAVCLDPNGVTDLAAFQALQHACWKQYRANGNHWLISDFITCAGAIAHADFYLLNKLPFSRLVKQKEFPVCPPVMEGEDKTLLFGRKDYLFNLDAETEVKRTVDFLNHGSPFAVTRWTNIYFKSDFVGGDARRVFRSGVNDIELPRKSPWYLPGGHTNYWDPDPENTALTEIARAIGFRQL